VVVKVTGSQGGPSCSPMLKLFMDCVGREFLKKAQSATALNSRDVALATELSEATKGLDAAYATTIDIENHGMIWRAVRTATERTATALSNCSRGFYLDQKVCVVGFLNSAKTLIERGVVLGEKQFKAMLCAALKLESSLTRQNTLVAGIDLPAMQTTMKARTAERAATSALLASLTSQGFAAVKLVTETCGATRDAIEALRGELDAIKSLKKRLESLNVGRSFWIGVMSALADGAPGKTLVRVLRAHPVCCEGGSTCEGAPGAGRSSARRQAVRLALPWPQPQGLWQLEAVL